MVSGVRGERGVLVQAWADRCETLATSARSAGGGTPTVALSGIVAVAAAALTAAALVSCTGPARGTPPDLGRFSAWSTPSSLGPTINSAANDQHPALSPDGLSLYFVSDRPGGSGGFDIYAARRATRDAPWGAPRNLGPTVNSSGLEFSPTLSRDGKRLYFASTRPSGCGGEDLYVSTRTNTSDDLAWGSPVNLGCTINTAVDEDGPTLFEDARTGRTSLYFTSRDRPGGLGDWDIYVATLGPTGTFGHGTLVPELSGPERDTRTALRSDGLEMLLASNRPGGLGGVDIWVSRRPSTREAWSVPIDLGPTINSSSNDGAPTLSTDGTTLIFYSDRPGGVGGTDLYVSTRRRLP